MIIASVSLVLVWCLTAVMMRWWSLQSHLRVSSSYLLRADHMLAHLVSLLQAGVSSREWTILSTFILSRVSLSPSSGIYQFQVSLNLLVLITYLSGMDASSALETSLQWWQYLASWGLHPRSWISSFEHQRLYLACTIFWDCRGRRKRTVFQEACSKAVLL